MKRTLYDILGIPADAGPEQILLAYKQHTQGPAAEHMSSDERALLKEAFSVLSHPGRRSAYDASLARQPETVRFAPPAENVFDSEPSRRWPLWLVGGLIVVGIIYAWQSRKSTPTAPAPVVVDRVVIVNGQPQPQTDQMAVLAPSSAMSSEDLFALLAPSTALVLATNKATGRYSQGSGVVIDQGTLVTNCHVTNDATDIEVRIGGETYSARVDVADREFDLCRLTVAGLSAPAVKIGSVSSVRTGQKVLALGAPKGLELTFSEGIVSSLRDVDDGTIIQTTAPISPGSSGGGLYSASGELVGIITLTHKFGQNLNFAVPADWIGQMQDRAALTDRRTSSAVAGTKPLPQPAPGGSDEPRMASIVARWHCFRPDFGKHVDLEFMPDGTFTGSLRGQALGGRYWVTGTSLNLVDSGNWLLRIEELSTGRMVLSDNRVRIACDRLG
jgi:serine protease Do